VIRRHRHRRRGSALARGVIAAVAFECEQRAGDRWRFAMMLRPVAERSKRNRAPG